jgi:hypothetical protein
MKELNKSNNNHHNNNHHNSNHNHNDINNNNKDLVIWIVKAVRVHLEVKIDIHKVGRKIIS